MSVRRHMFVAVLALGLGVATCLALAWGIARWRPIPQYPRNVARAFMLDGRAWATAESRITGGVSLWWDDLADSTLPPPRTGVQRALALMGARPAAPARTPDQLLADARTTHAQLAQERDGFVALDTPPSWGTFAQSPPLPARGTLGEDAAFGLPFPCLWYRVLSASRGNASVGAAIEHGYYISGTPNARATGAFIVLPLRPIWPAVLANSAIFAAVWWLLLDVPPRLRRVARRRRGRCVMCGYDLQATSEALPCPECGAVDSDQ